MATKNAKKDKKKTWGRPRISRIGRMKARPMGIWRELLERALTEPPFVVGKSRNCGRRVDS